MNACPACGHDNREGARFCDECGTKLEAAPLGEERRVCTIVFCDLVGFTERSDSLDPEDVRDFLVPYYELMEEEVTRYGGVIDKLYGDGAMAVFGAPTAHEDDAERAIRASLRVLERLPHLGLDLEARIGINTGEVVVSTDRARRGDALTGDTVNTASRIESAAPVGGVVVGDQTYTNTAHVFDYEALEPVELKGKAGKIPIFRPISPIAKVGVEFALDATPFVGRKAELAELIEVFERSRRERSVQFLTIVAEPGMGKSRLVRELSRYVEDLPDQITWRQGRCLPYGEGISFWALGEIVKSHAGILDSDDQPIVSTKLEAVLIEPDPRTRSWLKHRLAPLVGWNTTAHPPEREELFTAWRRFFASVAQEGPLVLVIEDLHWADDALVDFLTHLRERLVDLPVLVVITARPEVAERHPAWLASGSRELRLRALDEPAMRDLVATTLEDAPEEFREAVLERAGGSPLYAEQLAAMRRSMPIAGASIDDDGAIPPNIQALLTARIDQLPSELKAVLLDASVIGKTFWSGAVAALASLELDEAAERLDELEHREFIRAEGTSTIGQEAEFTFVHALVRDVAYGELSRRPRFAKHTAAAAWITDRVGRPLGDVAEIVVSHLDRAKEAAEAAGLDGEIPAIDDDLVEALTDAGEHARHTNVSVAPTLFERAIGLLRQADPRRTGLVGSLANAATDAGDYKRAAPLFEESIARLRSRGEWDGLGPQIAAYANVLMGIGGDVEKLLQDGGEELGHHTPGTGLLVVLAELALYEAGYGTMSAALERIAAANAVADQIGAPIPSKVLEAQGMVMLDQGDAGGERFMQEAFERALEGGALLDAAWLLNDIAVGAMSTYGYRSALDRMAEAQRFVEERGLDPAIGVSYVADWKYQVGRWDEVLADAPLVIEQLLAQDAVPDARAIQITTSQICLERGGVYLDYLDPSILRADDATSADGRLVRGSLGALFQLSLGRPPSVDAIEEVVAEKDQRGMRPSLLTIDVSIRCGRPDLAREIFERWHEENAALAHRYTCARALLAEASGDTELASDLLTTAVESSRRMDALRDEADMLFHVGRCSRTLGHVEDATTQLARSRALWRAMKADARIAEIDELLGSMSS